MTIVCMAALFGAAFTMPARAGFQGIQVSGQTPSSAAEEISAAGFQAVVVYYAPYRAPDDRSILEHFKQWGEAAKKAGLKLYVQIDAAPPVDAIAEPAAVSFRPAASDDGYVKTYIPAPASEDFWKTAVFPKLETLAALSEKTLLDGIFIKLAGHAGASYDAETFAEFLKEKNPALDASAVGPQERKQFLAEKGWAPDFEKSQEDRIFEIARDFLSSAGFGARLPIHLASWKDDLVHRGFLRATSEAYEKPPMVLHPFRASADLEKRPNLGGRVKWIESLSVKETTGFAAATFISHTAEDGWSGFLLADAGALWNDLSKVNVNEWPIDAKSIYLRILPLLERAYPWTEEAIHDGYPRLAARTVDEHSGFPKIALVYSNYLGYMFRDVFDDLLKETEIKLDKYENTRLEKLAGNINQYDAIVMAPKYNAVNPKKFMPYADDILQWVKGGGVLFILDATLPPQAEWMGKVDKELGLAAEEKAWLKPDWVNDEFKMLGFPTRIKSFPIGEFHFSNAAPGWRHLARDNEGMPYAVQRLYGEGMIFAVAHYEVEPEFLINGWEYMLKVKDRFDLRLDHERMPPLLVGGNDIPFVATTFGRERKLSVEARILNDRGDLATSNREIVLSREGGARFSFPMETEAETTYRMTLIFTDEDRDVVDKMETFAFRSPPAIQATLDKSYYTAEKEALLRIESRMAAVKGNPVLSGVSVSLLGADGRSYEVAGPVAQGEESHVYSIPLENLAPGEYRIRLKAISFDKNFRGIADDSAATLRKLPPGPNGETKLLNFLGGLTEVNGEPFFPLGIYSIPPENMEELRGAGANAMIYYGNTVEAEAALNAAAKDNGIRFAAYPFFPHKRLREEGADVLQSEVEEKAKSKNLFMWYLADEPELFGQSPELIAEAYKFVKEVDPYRPLSIVMADPKAYSAYANAADIFMFDRYPTPTGPLDTVGLYAQRAVQAVYGEKPVFAIPQAFDWRVWGGQFKEGETHRPDYAEMRSSGIQSIAAGVKGIIYWAFTASRYDMRKFPAHVEAFKRLMGEFSGLIDVLKEPNAFVDIAVEPDFKGIGRGSKLHDGKLYIFAYNGDPAVREKIAFTLPEEWAGMKVEPYSENRTIQMDGTEFADAFDFYGSHIYIVEP